MSNTNIQIQHTHTSTWFPPHKNTQISCFILLLALFTRICVFPKQLHQISYIHTIQSFLYSIDTSTHSFSLFSSHTSKHTKKIHTLYRSPRPVKNNTNTNSMTWAYDWDILCKWISHLKHLHLFNLYQYCTLTVKAGNETPPAITTQRRNIVGVIREMLSEILATKLLWYV